MASGHVGRAIPQYKLPVPYPGTLVAEMELYIRGVEWFYKYYSLL